MGRGQEHRDGGRTKGKRGESRPTVHRKAYRVNLSQSLSRHRGWASSEPAGPGLRGRWAAAVQRPLGQLGVDELVLLLTQGVDAESLHLLWPVIFTRLEGDITAAAGSSLLTLMIGRREFWTTHPYAEQQLVTLIEAREGELARSIDPEVEGLARDFVRRCGA